MRNEKREGGKDGLQIQSRRSRSLLDSFSLRIVTRAHRKAESMVLDRKHRRAPTYRALIFSRYVYPSWVFNFLFLTWPFPPHHAPTSFILIYIYVCQRISLRHEARERKNKAGRRSPRYTVDEFMYEGTNIRPRWSFDVKKERGEGETGTSNVCLLKENIGV